MGRREQREEMQRTWVTYTPRYAGVPMTRKDIEDADEASAVAAGVDAALDTQAERARDLSAALPRALIATGVRR